jgi:uncharacterized membrane protein YedE/YeeE
MIGSGMALTGACPGTVFVQLATGVPSAISVLLGGLAGGTLFVKLSQWFNVPRKSEQLCEADLTIASKLDVDPLVAVTVFDGLLVAVIAAASQLQPVSANLLNPILGGFLIGIAQLASVVLTHEAIGTSTAYEQAGKWLIWLTSQVSSRPPNDGDEKKDTRATPPSKSLIFVASLLLGAYTVTKLRPELIVVESMPISPSRGFIGGLVMVLGARLANGCTSGHGISGMSVLSIASVYSVTAMFGGGIALALALRM